MRRNGSLFGRASGRRQDVELLLEPDERQDAPGLAGVTIETAAGLRLSLDRGPVGWRRSGAPATGASRPGPCSAARRAARPASSERASAKPCCATRPTAPHSARRRRWWRRLERLPAWAPGASGSSPVPALSARAHPADRAVLPVRPARLPPSGNIEWMLAGRVRLAERVRRAARPRRWPVSRRTGDRSRPPTAATSTMVLETSWGTRGAGSSSATYC